MSLLQSPSQSLFLAITKLSTLQEYPYLWNLSHTLSIGSRVACATFNNDGSELIVTGSELLIYRTSDWKCSWSAQ